MASVDVVRSWKDRSYRASLSADQLQEIPGNPAGLVELTDAQLREASGVAGYVVTTFITCTEYTFQRFRCCK